MLLRRQESVSSLEAPSGLALEDGAHVLKCSSVTLQPGANKIEFRTQVWVGLGSGHGSQIGGDGEGA